MEYKSLQELINDNKIIDNQQAKIFYDSRKGYTTQIHSFEEKNNLPEDHYILYITQIFLNKNKNKYQNTKPLKCVIYKNRYGKYIKPGDCYIETDFYSLQTLDGDLHDWSSSYDDINDIETVFLTGESREARYNSEYSKRGVENAVYQLSSYTKKINPIHIFDNKKEAIEYINNFKEKQNLIKYNGELSDINYELNKLLKKKKELEDKIQKIQNL